MFDDESGNGQQGFLSRRFTRRDVLRAAGVAGVAGAVTPALAACGGSGGGTSSPSSSPSSASSTGSTPKKGGWLKVGIATGSGREVPDPHNVAYQPEIANAVNMYNRLVEFTPDYQHAMTLVTEVTPNADATEWTAHLRDGILFSDGRPVTADDVVFSFERMVSPKDPKGAASALKDLKPGNTTKVDQTTVKFTLDRPNAVWLDCLAWRECNIVPADFDLKKPIGTGPFALESFITGQQFVFTANSNYGSVGSDGPYLDKLSIIQYADPTARVNALISGSIDHCDELEASQVPVIKGQPGFAVWETKSGRWFPFTMRVDLKPFTDVRVRQAFRLIVDRQQMIDQAYGGYGWVGNDMYAPFDPGYPADLAQRNQDLEQAKSLLKAAGQEGLSITLDTSDSVGGGAVAAAQVFAEQAKGAGVQVKVAKHTGDVFYGDNYLKWLFAMDYWGTRNYLLNTLVGTQVGAEFNETHWGTDPKWAALVSEAFATPDDTKRNEMIAEASTIEYDTGGYIVWSFNILRDGYNTKLAGLVHDVAEAPANGFRYGGCYYA